MLIVANDFSAERANDCYTFHQDLHYIYVWFVYVFLAKIEHISEKSRHIHIFKGLVRSINII